MENEKSKEAKSQHSPAPLPLSTELTELELSVRGYNVLRIMGCNTIADVLSIKSIKSSLWHSGTIRGVRALLLEHGIFWKEPELTDWYS
jgi:hypothetical protein